ncbi:MAG: MBOAT family O-acyltransferase [Mastigocoleus sp.]
MLFNSVEFIFLFLPITLLFFFVSGSLGYYRLAIVCLVAASLTFYSWFNPIYLSLLLCSIIFNYSIGSVLSKQPDNKKVILICGVIVNLISIGYFKYANFFLNSVNSLISINFNLEKIILPLAISFFTFQQIAYLVDSYRGETKKYNFLDYCLFVTFFPQLIAGPIIHHAEIMPQFADKKIYRFNPEDMAVGMTIFSLGLFKKLMLADNISLYATPIFNAAAKGIAPTFLEAWIAALAYTLQLYFDFSGYSDMAIGIARMFGIKLPINFNSPYKAVNISDFWRRWHITLSNFLRDYLYIPLGGNRQGKLRRNLNLMITMLLGGLWHGAGWTYIFWGGLHGAYLIINHQWRSLRKTWGHDLKNTHWFNQGLSWLVTFTCVIVSWVFFRAENMSSGLIVLKGMMGMNGVSLPSSLSKILGFTANWGVQFDGSLPLFKAQAVPTMLPIILIILLLAIAWYAPNIQEWMYEYDPVLNHDKKSQSFFNKNFGNSKLWNLLKWQPNKFWALTISALTAISLLNLTRVSEFLYFQF